MEMKKERRNEDHRGQEMVNDVEETFGTDILLFPTKKNLKVLNCLFFQLDLLGKEAQAEGVG